MSNNAIAVNYEVFPSKTVRWTDKYKKTDRQRGIHTYKLRDRHSVEQTYRQMNGQTREINQRNTNRQMDRQTDGKTDGQTQSDRRTDRQYLVVLHESGYPGFDGVHDVVNQVKLHLCPAVVGQVTYMYGRSHLGLGQVVTVVTE